MSDSESEVDIDMEREPEAERREEVDIGAAVNAAAQARRQEAEAQARRQRLLRRGDQQDGDEQRPLVPRVNVVPEEFLPRQDISVAALELNLSAAGSAKYQPHVNNLNIANLVKLEDLIANDKMITKKKWMVMKCMGIDVSPNNRATVRNNSGRRGGGNDNNVTYNRMIKLCDPYSSEGANMVTMFEGHGHSPNVFNADITVRDTGAFRKYFSCSVLCYATIE